MTTMPTNVAEALTRVQSARYQLAKGAERMQFDADLAFVLAAAQSEMERLTDAAENALAAWLNHVNGGSLAATSPAFEILAALLPPKKAGPR